MTGGLLLMLRSTYKYKGNSSYRNSQNSSKQLNIPCVVRLPHIASGVKARLVHCEESLKSNEYSLYDVEAPLLLRPGNVPFLFTRLQPEFIVTRHPYLLKNSTRHLKEDVRYYVIASHRSRLALQKSTMTNHLLRVETRQRL